MSVSPAFRASVTGLFGGKARRLSDLVDTGIAGISAIPEVSGVRVPAALYPVLWYGAGILLYIAGSFPRGYAKNRDYGKKLGFFRGLGYILLLPVFSIIRIFKSLG